MGLFKKKHKCEECNKEQDKVLEPIEIINKCYSLNDNIFIETTIRTFTYEQHKNICNELTKKIINKTYVEDKGIIQSLNYEIYNNRCIRINNELITCYSEIYILYEYKNIEED